MMDPTGRTDAMLNSLHGLWVGDCIGNIGQLYFAHDILKALDEGIMKFGTDNINPMAQHFQYSDDTEEAIVLVNHIFDNRCYKVDLINQDKLAKEFAIRYYDRDPDGELYGYGLMTRKVLKEIYDGVDWRVANQTKPRIEGPSFVDKLISQAAQGKSLTAAMAEVNADIKLKMEKEPNMKVGSCGNGSAMRVAPLGAFCRDLTIEETIKYATLQSEVTHCHPEGIAGSIAVTLLARQIASMVECSEFNVKPSYLYNHLLRNVPKGQVWDGINKASELSLDTPISKLIEILGNGTHVTCQDTVPLCVFLTIRALTQYQRDVMYETVMIETCKCFGDVDTNCAIVGGMIGIISPPPEKWEKYCQPMEGVLGEPFPEKPRKPIQSKLGFDINKDGISEVMRETKPWGSDRYVTRNTSAEASYYKWLAEMEPNHTNSCEIVAKSPPEFSELIAERFPGKTVRFQ